MAKAIATEWDWRRNFAGCGIAVRTEEEARLWAWVRVAPTIEDDGGDVSLGVEAGGRKHLRKLVADAALVLVERSGEKFGAAALTLGFGAQAWVGEKDFLP